MKFLTKQDWEALLAKLYMIKTKSIPGQNNESSLAERIEKIIFEISQIIKDICYKNSFSHSIYGLSMTLLHYFICFNEFRKIDKIEMAFACFFMTSKIQFLNYKIKDIVAKYKEYIQNKLGYEKKEAPDFIKYEIQLFSQLGYDLDIETPYQMFYDDKDKFLEKFPSLKPTDIDKIKNFCFNLIDDTYMRPLSIYYHPKIIYLSCIILTIKFLEMSECNIEKIVEGENVELIAECMEYIYDIYSKYVENN